MSFHSSRLKEIHESTHCPAALREFLRDFLSVFAGYSGVYTKACEKIAGLLHKTEKIQLVDLCSGQGIYLRPLLRKIRESGPDTNWEALSTDLFPPINQEKEWKSEGLTISSDPMDAFSALLEYDAVFTMFSALHHFSENELKQLLKTAGEQKRPIAFFDYSNPQLLREFLPVLLSPLLLWGITPFLRPFCWKRILYTYILPAVPFLLLADGLISRLKSYTPEGLQTISGELNIPGYHLETGSYPAFLGLGKVTFLIGIPYIPSRSK